jgi:hypothetical protein
MSSFVRPVEVGGVDVPDAEVDGRTQHGGDVVVLRRPGT